MTEHEPSAELLTPQRVFERYMATSPQLGMGTLGAETLGEWMRVLESEEIQDPEEQLLAGWITTEYAFSISDPGNAERTEQVVAAFGRAAERFAGVANHPSVQVTHMLRGQAFIGFGAVGVLAAMVAGEPVDRSAMVYMEAQGRAARHILLHGETTGSARAAMWADALTVAMLSTQTDSHDLIFPASPRHMSPDVDGWYRHNAFGIDRETGKPYLIRVADDGPEGMAIIPPDMLGHSRYPSRSGYGTLEAITHQQEVTVETERILTGRLDAKRRDFLHSQIRKTQRHTNAVEDKFNQYLAEQKRVVFATNEATQTYIDSPRAWVADVRPGQYPFLLSRDMLDAAISPLELQLAEGELSSEDAMELAWMYAEVALGRAIDPDSAAEAIRGDIARAEEVFSDAMSRLESNEESLAFCEASLGFASLQMYEAVLCGDEVPPEVHEWYMEALMNTGLRARARYDVLAKGKPTPEMVELDLLIQRITFCLLAHSEGGGVHIALASTPRQRGRGGWDVNVWTEKDVGFTPGKYGRIRIAEKEEKGSLANGIATVTPGHLNQKAKGKRAVTFNAIINPDDPKRASQIHKAWEQVERAIEAAEI